ncbi:MAG: hypothetical protein MJ066_06025 [Clostridia bacterium]|nr:hypothetical protein [Clostridia bacterium]
MAIFEISEIEEKIGYSFKDKNLLRQCFTHSSYANEHNTVDNEKLEFFGDSIIKLVESEYLYNNQKGDEGNLTKKRQEMENNACFLETIKKLGLDKYVLLGNGQKKCVNSTEKLFFFFF